MQPEPLPVISGRPRDPAMRQVEANKPRIRAVLSRPFRFLVPDSVRWDEAYAAGLLGLWEAANRFGPKRGGPFSSYACIMSAAGPSSADSGSHARADRW